MELRCERCDKKLSRKTARMIDGKALCSPCVFPPMKRD
jgi:formylmethanofuran dehydrogenase subunit E